MISRTDVAIRPTEALLKVYKNLLNKEVHIKLEEDENPVLYTLRSVGKDFLMVDYGESKRIIPLDKILFVQIGDYPKARLKSLVYDSQLTTV